MPVSIDRTTGTAKCVLMVVANPGTSELTGWPIGFWTYAVRDCRPITGQLAVLWQKLAQLVIAALAT